jgi:NTE family protein
MGLEAIWEKCGTVLVSDAGAPLAAKPNPWTLRYSNVAGALRVLGITTEQTRALRKRELIENYQSSDEGTHRDGTYWGIATQIDHYRREAPDFPLMVRDNKLTARLKNMRTRLNPFSPEEQGHLINWGYALADAAMRRHVIGENEPIGQWPIKEYPLG